MLSCKNVHLTLNRTDILFGVSIDIRPGEFIALIGPNGAGKSSLISVLSGSTSPHSGSVSFFGKSIQAWHPSELARRRAVLPQSSELLFSLTVFEVVQLGRSPFLGKTNQKTDNAIIQFALDEVGASHLSHRIYATLSGGEKQRVQFARVLAQLWNPGNTPSNSNPRLLLLDEPTTNLDIAHQQSLLECARTLTSQNVGIIAVLHDPNLASIYADKINILSEGRMVASGPVTEVITEETLSRTFKTNVRVLPHPETARPIMIPCPLQGY